MAQIAGGRWDEFLRRLFGVKALPVAPDLAPEITPMILVQPPSAEDEYLRSVMLCQGFSYQANVAGELSQIILMNETEGTLVIVDRLNIWTDTASTIKVGFEASPGGTQLHQQRQPADHRWFPQKPTLSLFENHQVADAFTAGYFQAHQVVNSQMRMQLLEGPWVLPPNVQSLIIQSSANVYLEVGVRWRERPLDSNETR